MRWLSDLSISKKLLLALSGVLAATVFVGVFSLVQLERINTFSEEIASSWLPRTIHAADISRRFARVRMDQLQHLLSSTEGEMASSSREFQQHVSELTAAHDAYEQRISSAQERAAYDAYQREWQEYLKESRTIDELLQNHMHEPTRVLLGGGMKARHERAEVLLDRLVALNAKGAEGVSERARRLCASARAWIAGVPSAVLVFGLLFALFVGRLVSRPLRDLAATAALISEGDLRVEIAGTGRRDEAGRLAGAFADMVHGLRSMVGRVADAHRELGSMAEGLSGSTLQIASANEQVSAQSATVASSAEEMSVTLGQVSQNADEVRKAAESARGVALQGAAVIAQALEAMRESTEVAEGLAATVGRLGEQSGQIGAMLDLIEEIADQTTLLSLNAAIEAARAGSEGRGFAVVADEVRKLADKTVSATQRIGQTIASIQSESAQAVEAMSRGSETFRRGRELGEQARGAIRAIETQVTRATGQTAHIAAATAELTSTVQTAVVNIDEIAQGVGQNASAAGEIARTAEGLAQKALEMKTLISTFRA